MAKAIIVDRVKVVVEMTRRDMTCEELAQKELKEFLGHTPLEVLGGALLGVLLPSM